MAKKHKHKKPEKPTGITSPNKLQSSHSWWMHKHIPWFLFALGFLLYANTLTHQYTVDDAILIYDNKLTKQGLSGIPGIFSHDTFYGFFDREGTESLVSGGRYRPFTQMMFAIEYAIFGENPFIGHLLNAFFYGLTIMLVFFVLRYLFRGRLHESYAQLGALVAAILFAVHPLHTEVVANIKGRDEIMVLLLGLTSWWCWFRYIATGNAKKYMLLSSAAFMGALLSKEHAITLIPIFILGMWVFHNLSLRELGKWSVHLIIVTLAFLFIRGSVIGWSMGAPPMELMNNPFLIWDGSRYIPMSFSEQSATIMYTLGKYFKLLFWPWPLTHDYYPRHVDVMTWSDVSVLFSMALHIFLLVFVIAFFWRRNVFAFAVVSYGATLFLASNILFPIGTNMSERFLYLPSFAWALALGWAFAILYKMLYQRKTILLTALVAVSIIFSGLTFYRNLAWKDNFTLFLTDVEVSKNSAKLRNAAGGELITQAIKPENELRRNVMVNEAIGHLQRAIEIHPTYKNAFLLLGNGHYYLQEYEAAIDYYRRALQIDPAYREAQSNLAITLRDGGRYFGEQAGDIQRALSYLQESHQLNSTDYETLRLLGVAHGVSGNAAQAIRFFELAANKQPGVADAWMNLSRAYQHTGNTTQAEFYRQKALEIDPNVQQ